VPKYCWATAFASCPWVIVFAAWTRQGESRRRQRRRGQFGRRGGCLRRETAQQHRCQAVHRYRIQSTATAIFNFALAVLQQLVAVVPAVVVAAAGARLDVEGFGGVPGCVGKYRGRLITDVVVGILPESVHRILQKVPRGPGRGQRADTGIDPVPPQYCALLAYQAPASCSQLL